jgi:pheromone shutdown-related protein TraB
MKIFQNLTLIGTSHIAQQSIQEVSQAIEQIKPQIVALELDKNRFYALTHKRKRKVRLSDMAQIGFKGYLFALIGAYIQKKLGQIVKIQPGAEMLTAIKLAQKNKIKIALIDQPIEITLKRFSQEFTWKEKFRFIADIFKGLFFRKRELKKYHMEKFDFAKVPEEKLIKQLIKQLRQRYPSIYKVLIKERNLVIAKNLTTIIKQNPSDKIIAVVGAGHETELINLISKNLR